MTLPPPLPLAQCEHLRTAVDPPTDKNLADIGDKIRTGAGGERNTSGSRERGLFFGVVI